MRPDTSFVVLGLCLAFMQCATASGLPHRKNGLWETSMKVAQHAATGIKAQQCIDEHSDEAMQRRAMEGDPSLQCARADVSNIPGGFETSSVCKTNRGTLTSKMHITGDMQSAYRMEISAHRDPPQGTLTDTQTIVDAKWLGACPADMKAGDMRINGMILHMGGAVGAAGAGGAGGVAGKTGAGTGLDPEAMKSMTPAQRLEYLKKKMAAGAAPTK